MFSIFPSLLTYSLLSIAAIRIVIGLVLLNLGITCLFIKRTQVIQKLTERHYPAAKFITILLGILAIICGSFLVLGFLTQVIAIVAAYTFINIGIVDKGENKIFGQGLLFYFVMTIFSLSLVIFGAGLFAIDLPL